MMGKVLLYGQPRGIANFKIVAMARILLLWMTLGDNTGVAALNANSEPLQSSSDKPPLVFRSCDDVEFNADSLHRALNRSSTDGHRFVIAFIAGCKFAERRPVIEQYCAAYGEELSDAWLHTFYLRNERAPNTATKHTFDDTLANALSLIVSDLNGTGSWNEDKSLKHIFLFLIESSDSDPISAALRDGTMYDTIKSRVIASSSPTGRLWSIFESQLNGRRSNTAYVDDVKARKDAEKILAIMLSDKCKKDLNDLHDILMMTSYPQLRKVLEYYNGPSLEAEINETFPSLVAWAYNEILLYANFKTSAEYFAEKIKVAADDWWCVFILWRREIDLDEIKRAYRTMYGVSLRNDKRRVKFNINFEAWLWLTIVEE